MKDSVVRKGHKVHDLGVACFLRFDQDSMIQRFVSCIFGAVSRGRRREQRSARMQRLALLLVPQDLVVRKGLRVREGQSMTWKRAEHGQS